MGVHLSFVRSTVLDTWTWDQLRLMRVGGNAAAAEYFKKHGGTSLLSIKDAKIKYSSKAASQYKEEIKKRALLDAKQHPDFDFDEDLSLEVPESKGLEDDDFFSSWDKPSIVKPTPPPSRTSTPPVLGRTVSNTSQSSETTKATPKVSNSSSLRKVTTAGNGGTRRSAVLGGGQKRTTKTTVKKVGPELDFDELERKAKEEAERIAQLGYDAAEEERSNSQKSIVPSGTSVTEQVTINNLSGRRDAENVSETASNLARLGFGQTANTQQANSKKSAFGLTRQAASEVPTTARDKYSSQKSISSDQFFGRGGYDANAQAEAKQRLTGFSGAQSISSNQYFGRDEEEDNDVDSGDLEATARQYISQLQNLDTEKAKELLGTGAIKLGRYIDDLARNF